MRDFLPMTRITPAALSCLAIAPALAVSPFIPAPAVAATATAATAPRILTDLSQGWRFRFGGDAAGVSGQDFDDAAWQTVALPHSWNRIGAYETARPYAGRNNDQGTGWYRLAFPASRAAAGRRTYLEFDGVGAVARVWLNGRELGGHRGAFSRFRFDVTDQLRAGRNLLVVSADNSKPKPGAPTADVLPLAGDFFIYGGIYRGVRLIEADEVQIDLLDHGGPGVYARTVRADAGQAEVQILTRLRNAGRRARRLTLSTMLVDTDGRVAGSVSTPAALAAAGATEATQRLVIPRPHLWNGTADPHAYQLVVELKDGNRVVDTVRQAFGIRTMMVDANRGFILNGKPLPLHGISRHQDMMGAGWALSAKDHAGDMAIAREIGANTIRLAHYQHAQEWVDAADAAGMVTWAEIPFVTAANLEGKAPTPALTANAQEQLVELIRQNYNHPSIAMWSIGNEVNAGELFLPGRKPQQSLGLLRTLDALAKREDASRPTTFADCCEDSAAFTVTGPPLAGTADLIGYNRYYGWYYGKPADLGPELDKLHAKHPALPMAVTEYGAGGGVTQHSDNPEGGQVAIVGRPHPEEYQSWYHEESWKQLAARPYLYANWIWALFDFASDFRGEGDSIDMNDKGLVTFDRKTRKDAFYFYQAQWSDAPVLHLTGHNYVDRAYPVVDVRAYSNAARASLRLNGADLGEAPCVDRVCVWKSVRLRQGENVLDARATIAGRAVADSLRWVAPNPQAGLHIEAGELNGRVSGGVRYGSDNFFAGGTSTLLNPLVLRAGAAPPSKTVLGAGDLALHRAYREGAFRYDLPLSDGEWRITIHTLEPDPAQAATRRFDVIANGRRVIKALNPSAAAGAPLTAVSRVFRARSEGGFVHLQFMPRQGAAIVSAIDVDKGEK